MTYFKNKSGWFWAFIVLLVVNITAIGTMVYTLNKIHRDAGVESYYDYPAKKKDFHNDFRRKNMAKKIQKRMGYSDEQMKIFKEIRLEHMNNMRNNKIELRKAQMMLFDEVSLENPDLNKIKSLKKKILDIEGKIMDESVSFYSKLKENSTPEQMQKMNMFYRRHLFRAGPPVHTKNITEKFK
jgi:Spy/CpxP family protein refolding chaperone